MADTHFLLKTSPPRPNRNALASRRLEHRWAEINDRLAIVVTAPQGFGKTTLLAQWRRNWLQQDAVVAWATLDAEDDRARFVKLLLFALRLATGRDCFRITLADAALRKNREIEILTSMLDEVSRLAAPVVIVLDDAHRMPQDVLRDLLAYLFNNAPPNLQFVISTRRPLGIELTDLLATGRLAELDAGDLRLRLDETFAVLRARFGSRIDIDDAARLHGITEGWPLGLQLVVATLERGEDPHEVIGQLSARRGDIQRFFFETMLSRMPADAADFLVRTSILEVLREDVCSAVSLSDEASRYLQALVRESPIVTLTEERDWLRLHSMARDFLLGQFDQLPPDERRGCYERAASWYAEHGQLQAAARHALAAGDDERAGAYASQCLLEIAGEGQLAEARDWVRRLSPQAIARDLHLQLTIAWVTALSEDAASVPATIEHIRSQPNFDDSCRFEAAIVEAAAAIYRDEHGRLESVLREWPQAPQWASPLHVGALATSHGLAAIQAGDTERGRQALAGAQVLDRREPAMRTVLGFNDMAYGLSYVWEGFPVKAIAALRPRLETVEQGLGRRSLVAAFQAAVLAAAYMLVDEHEQAAAMLADRLDVVERTALPDAVMLSYRALGEVALARGDEQRALEFFIALADFGAAHDLPRLSLVGQMLQIRVHAVLGHVQVAEQLLEQVEILRAAFAEARHRAMAWHVEPMLAVAEAYVMLARSKPLLAFETLSSLATKIPSHARRSVTALTVQALRTVAAHQSGKGEAPAMLHELLSLAELAGTEKFVLGLHPGLRAMLAAEAEPLPALNRRVEAAVGIAKPVAPLVAAGGLLTPQEARILALLAAGKANKEIARAMDVGEQTVKWHLKNLFFKLDAGGRKHAVDRARLLGLIRT